MTELKGCKTPITDLLRKIPIGSWLMVTEPNGWSYSTNIGNLTNQAADEIDALRKENEELQEKVKRLMNFKNGYGMPSETDGFSELAMLDIGKQDKISRLQKENEELKALIDTVTEHNKLLLKVKSCQQPSEGMMRRINEAGKGNNV
jgi:cell division protein FtsB